MPRDFDQLRWNQAVEDDCRSLVRLAIREDLDRMHDWTTVALVPQGATGAANVVFRTAGVVAGLPACEIVLREMSDRVAWNPLVADGAQVTSGTVVATLEGSIRDLLVCERPLLNMLGHLSGIATLTRQFVDQAAPQGAAVYDTRKTTPGWRRLDKYAVGCGGGRNHRTGLFDAILIKDNHLAACQDAGGRACSPAEAVRRVRGFLEAHVPEERRREMLLEVEVDTLAQLDEVLPTTPDIVLLDNMTLPQLREAVARRDALAPGVQLEASGGVSLDTIGPIAATGVERISVGALTHSAPALDCGLDWR